ncbi:UNVERIFIED_CONTAM: hypothetical protein FKN15_026957 [Acipenser sinensis]
MDRNALAELLQALESRRDAEERRREERYTALIERLSIVMGVEACQSIGESAGWLMTGMKALMWWVQFPSSAEMTSEAQSYLKQRLEKMQRDQM